MTTREATIPFHHSDRTSKVHVLALVTMLILSLFLVATYPTSTPAIQIMISHLQAAVEYDVFHELEEDAKSLVGGNNLRWKLHKLGGDAACLDGSPAGYWFSDGDGEGVNKFVIHHMGGGWCNSVQQCKERAHTSKYGSSNSWTEDVECDARRRLEDASDVDQPCHNDNGMHGLLDTSPTVNPMMYNWNKVYVGYCDGASFSGNVIEGVKPDGSDEKIFFRGHAILDAVYDSLINDRNMAYATDIVISGSSAGALAVLQHIDYIANKIRSGSMISDVKIAGIPDAGYFLDVPDATGEQLHRMEVNQGFRDMYTFQNLKPSLNPACLSQHEPYGDAWKCSLPQYFLQFVETPLFIIQSFADQYQFTNVMGLTCTEGTCTDDDIKYLNNFRGQMLESIDTNLRPRSGYWITDCNIHTIADRTSYWTRITVDGMKLGDAVHGWYFETFGVVGRGRVRGHPSRTWKFSQGPWRDGGFPEC